MTPPVRLTTLAFAILTIGCREAKSDLEQQWQSWRSVAPRAYEFEYSWQCFCPGGGIWWRLTVENDLVTSAAVVDSSNPGKGGIVPPAEGWPTVDSVFARITRERASSDSVEVSYDPEFHFPRRVRVDRIRNAIDDEWTIELRGFRARPGPGQR